MTEIIADEEVQVIFDNDSVNGQETGTHYYVMTIRVKNTMFRNHPYLRPSQENVELVLDARHFS